MVVFNKPPGVMVLGKEIHTCFDLFSLEYLDETWDRKTEIADENDGESDVEKTSSNNSNPCTIQYHMPQFRSALKWSHFFPCIRTPK